MISLQIFLPQGSGNSQSHEGRIEDVSSSGMRVSIGGMSPDQYRELSALGRPVRVNLRLAAGGNHMNLAGSIAWFSDSKAEIPGESGRCDIGICFDKEGEIGLPGFSAFVQSAQSSIVESNFKNN